MRTTTVDVHGMIVINRSGATAPRTALPAFLDASLQRQLLSGCQISSSGWIDQDVVASDVWKRRGDFGDSIWDSGDL
jgi:hypothetical protein